MNDSNPPNRTDYSLESDCLHPPLSDPVPSVETYIFAKEHKP